MAIPAENVRNYRVLNNTPGTPVALFTSNKAVASATIVALDSNTQKVAIGGIDAVTATAGSQNSALLASGDAISFGPCDLADIHLDVRVSGEGVAIITEE